MRAKIKNLTPHEISVYNEQQGDHIHIMDIPPSGEVARVDVKYVPYGIYSLSEGTIPIYQAEYGEVTGLPEKAEPAQDDTSYIVSGMVKTALPDRDDLLSPGELLRDENGRPIGCVGLVS